MVDIFSSTGASHRACTTSRKHFIGFEADKDIFDALLKPLCESSDFTNDNKDDDSDEDPRPGLCNELAIYILSLDFNF